MSAALAVMCLVMIGFGAVRISGAVENRDRSREAAQNLAEKTENYIKLSTELDSSPVDYDEVSEEQTERRDKYDSDNSRHRADVAEYTATKGGTAMGSLALDEAAYAIQVGWEQYYAGVREMNEQLGDYALTDGETVGKMVDYSFDKLKNNSYNPYYLYRQKHMVGDFENIGYSKKGYESLYNIMIMEETNSIVSLGCGGVTKIVNLPNDKIERVFNVKEAVDYVTRIDEMCRRKNAVLEWLA